MSLSTLGALPMMYPPDKSKHLIYPFTHIPKKGGGEVLVRLNANVEEELAKRLKHALVEEGISFSGWLRKQIETHLAEKEKTARRRRGRGA